MLEEMRGTYSLPFEYEKDVSARFFFPQPRDSGRLGETAREDISLRQKFGSGGPIHLI